MKKRLSVDKLPNTVGEAIISRALAYPTKAFSVLAHNGAVSTLTYGDLAREAAGMSCRLRDRGVTRSDVVVIMMNHDNAIFPAFAGAMLLGAIPSIFPVLSPQQDAELFWAAHRRLFERLQPKIIVTDTANVGELRGQFPGFADRIATYPHFARAGDLGAFPIPQSDEDDIAFLQHSSGTTNLKKGVALTHRIVLAQAAAYSKALSLTQDDVIASWLPLYHDMGLIACFILPVLLGISTINVSPFEWVSRPSMLLDAIDRYGATLAWMPNFAFLHIVRTAPHSKTWNLSSLRALINCSEPCKPAAFDAFRKRFGGCGLRAEALQVCYAMAENVFAVTQTDLSAQPRRVTLTEDARSTEYLSCGKPIDGVSVRIVSDDGNLRDDGVLGQIQIAGSSLFGGYFLQPETASLRNGWYATGDMGFILDEELYVTGRMDDMLIVRGKNLYAHEIERTIRHDGLKPGRVVALGIYNERLGSQDLVIVAERADDATDADVKTTRLIKAEVFATTGATVSDVRLVERGWLLKTTSGKISREANARKYVKDFGLAGQSP